MTPVPDSPPPRPRRPLFRQFVRQLLAPLLLAFVLATLGTVLIAYQTKQGEEIAERERTLETFARSLVKPLWDCDNATASGILDALAHQPAVLAARLDERCQGQHLLAGAAWDETGEGAGKATVGRLPIVYEDERGREFALGELAVAFHPPSIAAVMLEVLWRYLALFSALFGVLLGGTLLIFRRMISEPLARFQAAIRASAGSGDLAPLEEEMHRHNDELGDVMRAYDELMIKLASVIGQLRDNETVLQEAARRDPLTGLGNRLALEEELTRALARARRSGEPGCVLLLDLNRFKPINDTWGHAAGDNVLQETARRLSEALRASDTIVRLGGDEFVVIMENLQDRENLPGLIAKLGEIIARPQPYGEHGLTVGASIGTACFPADGETSAALLAHADRAMYASKRGR
ncbi:sensor domain-containing diguanylate cyclase [Thauera linaloolentis]|uniref:Periplasmic/7TM domain sensor diguanylate cyclase n=1 Tax=Thauera linaloolentis (strain DSM 12138 / JCM 21573 / CCUG 41526 / CIP 105981 / IAM 15112 / NBRC 102519 / 47Lol) TaxID=1123367 RepID=N6XYP9_THAL4|nr:sensor domain-containing diguanylate cyclase [Thauera linaloolentis]ENO86916.1 periplasmic/7TM domain sensor diguanylate cyclase [Thauera linaloolentis 47Lol = DSM 12138]MCM8566659.1 diguanylate cyclase [Thauera linaloolentis]